MARLAVTSIVRHAAPGERSGYLRMLDLDGDRVVSSTPVPESAFRVIDPNPRGGYRGAKGLGVYGGRLVVANSERLFVFDRSWELQSDLTHPLLGSVHDILAEEDGILVTCTNCDTLLGMSWDGVDVSWWTWRRDPGLARELGYRRPPPFDPAVDYRDPRSTRGQVLSLVQLNAVTRNGDALLLSFGRVVPQGVYARKRAGAVVERLVGVVGAEVPRRLTRESLTPSRLPTAPSPGSAFAIVELQCPGGEVAGATGRIVYRQADVSVPNHNLVAVDGRILFNDSNAGRLVELDPERGEELRAVVIPGEPSFARGLCAWRDGLYLVGSQRPTAVHAIDLEGGQVVRSFVLSDDTRESVYAVCLVPDEFDDVPAALPFPDA